MLTNNKKSYFVKSIAMIMAVLMVLAVCLTGCGNKAAEEAAKKSGADVVQVIGRKFVVYKRNLKEPKIILP